MACSKSERLAAGKVLKANLKRLAAAKKKKKQTKKK